MRTAPPLMRLLAAILRVVALVVLVPVVAQAHAGHGHAGLMQAGTVQNAAGAIDAVRLSVASPAVTAESEADRAECLACASCCCGHVFVAVPDAGAGRADRPNSRRVAVSADATPASAGPEAIPEPPRPFA